MVAGSDKIGMMAVRSLTMLRPQAWGRGHRGHGNVSDVVDDDDDDGVSN